MAEGSRLKGKVAVVTGGAGGLGQAIAQAFADEGAAIVLVGRSSERLQDAAAQLVQAGAEAIAIEADLTDHRAIDAITPAAVERFGKVDVLVNCAGVFIWRSFDELTDEDWHLTLDTNLTAPFLLTQRFARQLIEQGGGGCVINLASIHGMVAEAEVVPHCAAKFGLVGMTRAIAEALRPHGIRVNAISPGAVEPDSAALISSNLQGRVTQADIAQMAVYLASDAAAGVTGANLEAYGISRPVVGPLA